MNKDLSTYELIQNFLDGNLSGDELKDFEKRREVESGFEQYLQNHKAANLLIRQKELEAIRNELKNIHQNSSGYGRNWLGLGIIGFLILASALIYFSDSRPINQNRTVVEETHSSEKVTENHTALEVSTSKLNSLSDDNNSVKELKNSSKTKGIEPIIDTLETSYDEDESIAEMTINQTPTRIQNSVNTPDVLLPAKDPASVSNQKDAAKSADCSSYSVTLDLNVSSSCTGKNSGRIEIRNEEFFQNYSFAINDNYPQINPEFKSLASGIYNVYLIDENDCKSDPTSVLVEERNCDVIISESQRVYWEIPTEFTNDDNMNLEVYHSRSGNLVFSDVLDANGINVWNGRDFNNQYLPVGLYTYKIQNNRTTCSGEIRILP